jgi:hypothetical protein
MSAGSSSSRTSKEKKRLRFTPVANGTDGLEMGLLANDHGDAEEGTGKRHVKGKSVARDQADYLSAPGTPNLSET